MCLHTRIHIVLLKLIISFREDPNEKILMNFYRGVGKPKSLQKVRELLQKYKGQLSKVYFSFHLITWLEFPVHCVSWYQHSLRWHLYWWRITDLNPPLRARAGWTSGQVLPWIVLVPAHLATTHLAREPQTRRLGRRPQVWILICSQVYMFIYTVHVCLCMKVAMHGVPPGRSI